MQKIIILLFTLLLSSILIAQSKIALIIGNSAYQQVPLKNPVNDAYDLSNTLKSLGFYVIKETNLNRKSMEIAISSFTDKIKPGDVALFYFSGHGTQVNGLNYLIPVNESISNEVDVKYHCVDAGYVLDNMEQAGAGINIIILDACRNNPFSGHRSASRGFAFMSAPAGSIIAYSTSPGKVALDGDGRNSPFTSNFIEKIRIPGLKIEEVFKEVRKDVASETNRRQIPWESSSPMGDFYFTKGTSKKNASNNYNNDNQPTTYNPPVTKISIPHESYNGNSGTFTDKRDGQRYKWVRIGKQIWMGENLNYKTNDSWCYDNNKGNCNKYGRLYKWKNALKTCPRGWHLPSDDEWKIIEVELGMTKKQADEWGARENAGSKLRSKEGWDFEYNGNNSSGFNSLPSGIFTGLYSNLGSQAYWWTSTKDDKTSATTRYLSWIDINYVYRHIRDKSYGLSVRCIKN